MDEVITLIGTTLGFLASTILFIIKAYKAAKENKESKNELNVSNMLLALIEEAEKFLNYTGEEKKAYVTTRVKEALLSKKIMVDDSFIEQKIEELVSLSKNVNQRTKSDKALNKLYGGD